MTRITTLVSLAAAASILAAALVSPPADAATAAASAPSLCKGLAQDACATAAGSCRWQAARVAGETITRAGTPAKTSAKAHCRKAPPKAEKAS